MILKQDIYEGNLVKWEDKSYFAFDCEGNEYLILYDLHLPNGQRVHFVKGYLESVFVWNNAIIAGENHLHKN